MPKRDSNGRFIKNDEEGYKIIFTLPKFSNVLFWGLLLIVLSPWILIIAKLEIWKKIVSSLEGLFLIKEENNGPNKKNGLFS